MPGQCIAKRRRKCTLYISTQGGYKTGKLEKPGICRDFSEHGIFREFSVNFVQPQGKM